jgi:hypothetical protein
LKEEIEVLEELDKSEEILVGCCVQVQLQVKMRKNVRFCKSSLISSTAAKEMCHTLHYSFRYKDMSLYNEVAYFFL